MRPLSGLTQSRRLTDGRPGNLQGVSLRKRPRLEISRPGVPAQVSLAAFRVPDKLSPPVRADDKVTKVAISMSMFISTVRNPASWAAHIGWPFSIRAGREPELQM